MQEKKPQVLLHSPKRKKMIYSQISLWISRGEGDDEFVETSLQGQSQA